MIFKLKTKGKEEKGRKGGREEGVYKVVKLDAQKIKETRE